MNIDFQLLPILFVSNNFYKFLKLKRERETDKERNKKIECVCVEDRDRETDKERKKKIECVCVED